MLHGYRQVYSSHKNRRHLCTAKDVKKIFDNWNYELDRPLPKGRMKK